MDPNQQIKQDNPALDNKSYQQETSSETNWQYTSGQLTADNPTQPQDPHEQLAEHTVLAEWTAQEFIEHDKNLKWYLLLGGGATVLSVIIFLVTKEIMSVVVVVLLAVAVGFYGSAKPKTVKYTIYNNGIDLDDKHYSFIEFKSFSMIEGPGVAAPYVQFMPQKKLLVPITIFIDPAHANEIVELIGKFVPYDQRQPDFAEKLATRFRF